MAFNTVIKSPVLQDKKGVESHPYLWH